ncbi:MAG TPA: nucleoside transporter C-terminal domain-containing protein [Desulfobacterales bacterium]|nr:nucleoside transporter C-terminal domain-containing protein [Desulfobacterales bacterium]
MIWQSALGCGSFIALAWLLSENRRRVSIRLVAKGLLLTFAAGGVLVYVPFSRDVFALLNRMVLALQEATAAGTSFVFGYLGGGPLPFAESFPGSSFILAFQALPMVLLMSALSSLLFYWKVLPVVVRGFSWCLRKTMGVGGAEGLANSVNVFVGMVEAPLFIRPYLERMTRSELFSVMTCGMANVAGTVMALYAFILGGRVPNAMGHILVASLLSLPASITIARIMIPETGEATAGEMSAPETATSSMDAVTKGTLEGVHLLVNIIGMLIVLVALVTLVNLIFGLFPDVAGSPLSLQRLAGLVMAPVCWLMGVPWSEAPAAGALMGTKTVLNELIAYLDMSRLPAGTLSPRSLLIMTYALCGFANPGSMGIMIGGMSTMAPGRRNEIVELGLRAIVSGTLTSCLIGSVVGVIGA